MKTRIAKLSVLACCLALACINSNAQAPKKKLDKNPNENTLLEARRNHKQRIQEGIKSGELTKSEAKQLTDMEDKIKQAMYKAKQSNGVINEQERDEIKDLLHQLSKQIDELKSNKDRR